MGGVLTRHAGYDEDFFRWTREQADAIRAAAREGSNAPVDWDNVAEEIESLGKADRRACGSLINRILAHLAKLRLDSDSDAGRHWRSEISAFRGSLARILDDSPSLRARLADFVAEEHPRALRQLLAECEDRPQLAGRVRALMADPRAWFTAAEAADEDFLPKPLDTP